MSKEKAFVSESGASKDNVRLKCGDCLHYQSSPHPSYGEVCNLRGVKTFATAPNCYTANINVFRKVSPDTFSQLYSLLSSFTPQQNRVLMGLLKTQTQVEKSGFTFLQKVYFLLGHSEYLENYYSAYVMGVGPDKEILLVGRDYLRNHKSPVVAQMMADSLMTFEEFKERRRYLQSSGKLSSVKRLSEQDKYRLMDSDYVPPTIETSAEELEKKASVKKQKKRNSENTGFVTSEDGSVSFRFADGD